MQVNIYLKIPDNFFANQMMVGTENESTKDELVANETWKYFTWFYKCSNENLTTFWGKKSFMEIFIF